MSLRAEATNLAAASRASGPSPALKRGQRDVTADLARWPVEHLRGCPAATDPEQAASWVEIYADRRITSKGAPQDVTADTRPSVAIMVAHCCLCGALTYHDVSV